MTRKKEIGNGGDRQGLSCYLLVAVTMKRLAEMFTAERARLEGQWDRGGNVSTEELRLALRRCRSFFGRCSRCNKVGAAGLIGNAILARINNHAALETEQRRGQTTLIVEAMKTGKPEDANSAV